MYSLEEAERSGSLCAGVHCGDNICKRYSTLEHPEDVYVRIDIVRDVAQASKPLTIAADN